MKSRDKASVTRGRDSSGRDRRSKRPPESGTEYGALLQQAAEALRTAEAGSGEIALLITDVIMPEMNGRELAGHLVALQPHLKTLFVSGYATDVISDRGMLDEGVHFLQKPFTPAELAATVRATLDGE